MQVRYLSKELVYSQSVTLQVSCMNNMSETLFLLMRFEGPILGSVF